MEQDIKQVRILYHDDPEPKKMSGRQDWISYYNSYHDDPDILSAVWEQWNAGSGNECQQFLKLDVRSMMVGDYVSINGVWHECLPFGWRIDVPWEEVMGDAPKDKSGHEVTHNDLVKKIMKQIKNLDSDEISFAE